MRKLLPHEIPPQLFEIPEPPKELWIEGTMPPKDSIFLCVVGSRKHSLYGQDACQKIIHGLKGYPIIIVSGLALGIDTIAHEAALFAGLKTISFPGSGLNNDVLYPRSNWQLANRILEGGGALISELAPETPAALWTFPKRNRLMAGIAQATLLIEADEKSGTLITARLALDYNRDLFVVPGSIFSPTSRGTNRLMKDGAMPITSSEDLLFALGFNPKEDVIVTERTPREVTEDEQSVLDNVGSSISRDELIYRLGKPVSETNMLISMMELKGLIKEDFGEIRRV